MMESKDNPEKLKDKRNELANHLGDKGNQVDDVIKSDKNKKRIEINREEILNQLLKAIELTPMDELCKHVLRVRLTAKEPSLELMYAARLAGIKFQEVLKIEEYAKSKVSEFLKKHSIQDIVNDFNQNSRNARDLKQKMIVNPVDRQAAKEKE
jgi:hypothetical protein